MAHIVNYNSTIHDLYIYDSAPILNWENNIYSWAKPIGFNPSLYLNSITGYMPGVTLIPSSLDFSGIVARKRGAAYYLSAGLGGRPNANPAQYFNGFGSSTAIPPINNDTVINAVRTDGWCGNYLDIRDDYNYWNTGDIPGCLISPAHVLVGGHMIDPLWEKVTSEGLHTPDGLTAFDDGDIGDVGNPFIKLRFVGSGNTYYDRLAYLSFFLNGTFEGPCTPKVSVGAQYEDYFCQQDSQNLGLTFEDGKDLAILELRDPNDIQTCLPLSSEELKYVKIYKIANARTWPNNWPMFMVTPNGVVTIHKKSSGDVVSQSNHFYNSPIESNLPAIGWQLLNGLGGKTPVVQAELPVYGDSCNFMYGYYPPSDELVFLASINSIRSWFTYNRNSVPYEYEFLKSLKEWIYNRIYDATGTGYYIDWIDYNGATSSINYNGSIHPLISSLPAGTTQTFYSGFTIPGSSYGFTSGITYSFIVSASNSAGFSGFAGPSKARIT